jgi:LPXTG-motif cell wall-anchored protein
MLAFGTTLVGLAVAGRTVTLVPQGSQDPVLEGCTAYKIDGGDIKEGTHTYQFKIPPFESIKPTTGSPMLPADATVTMVVSSDKISFDWSSNYKFGAIYVKGGNQGGNLYQYDPPVNADQDLHLPTNQSISHVVFYYCGEPEEPEYGSLKVTKKVFGDEDLNELPDFVITVTGPEGFSDTKTIAKDGSYTWENLKPGIYTVSEDTTGFSEEWMVEIETVVGEVTDGKEGEVDVIVNRMSEVVVKNTYDEIEEESFGSLTVYKEVLGDVSGLGELPDFIITVEGPEGFSDTKTIAKDGSYTWHNLKPGIYTVSEDTTGFSSEWTVEIEVLFGEVEDGEEGEVEVFADLESEVKVKNIYDEIEEESFGSLTVYKEVYGDVSGLAVLPDFIITVEGPEGFSSTKTIAAGGSYTWNNLKPGIYYVSEDVAGLSAEWTVGIEVLFGEVEDAIPGEVEVYADLESEVLVKNTYDEIDIEAFGSLTVYKVVAGDIDELDELPEFIFTVTGPNGFTDTKTIAAGGSYTWHDLESGTYTVTEDKSKLGEGWTVKGEGSVEVVEDLESEITVTNTYNDLPDTGGDPITMILSGMLVAGAGAVIRRKRR